MSRAELAVGDRVKFTITRDDGPGTSPYEVEREGIIHALTEPREFKDGLKFPGLAGIIVTNHESFDTYMVRRDQIL